jgi:NADP-dependent 3-hydroxy acid dehydrogenase YdfG
MRGVDGKVVAITGASSGIGEATALLLAATRDTLALPPEAIARAIAFAIEQPDGVDVGDIVVRPTAQG